MPAQPSPARHVLLVVALALLTLVLVEAALQLRAHFRQGQSVFNALRAETRYVRDERLGIPLLRPNRVLSGSEITLRSNSLGLRSEDLAPRPAPGVIRIAVLGASTVMGAYAASNEDTFPYRMQALLNARADGHRYEVVNAGIAGLTLREQAILLENVVAGLSPDLVVAYPGFNDFTGYCEPPARATKTSADRSLPQIRLPEWLLTVDLLTKNSASLRQLPDTLDLQRKDPDALDLSHYARALDRLDQIARAHDMQLVMSTMARSFREEQPPAEQRELAGTALHYYRCFDLAGLHALYDRHNATIEAFARDHDIPLVRLAQHIPGGRTYFVDAGHFSASGEQRAAEAITAFLSEQGLLDTLAQKVH